MEIGVFSMIEQVNLLWGDVTMTAARFWKRAICASKFGSNLESVADALQKQTSQLMQLIERQEKELLQLTRRVEAQEKIQQDFNKLLLERLDEQYVVLRNKLDVAISERLDLLVPVSDRVEKCVAEIRLNVKSFLEMK